MPSFFRSRSKFLGQKETTRQGASLNIESFPSGIKTLSDPPDATLDVVFVHGLTGDRERTWTCPSNNVCWPRDLLPTSLPNARILAFGYDAYIVRNQGQVAQIDIAHHANDLLNSLASERREHQSAVRPIVFVAHSLGGILCKDALRISEISGEVHLQAISIYTCGIAFVGTPHGGSWLANWARIPATILGVLKRSDVSLLSLLKPDSEVLGRIHSDFLAMLRRRDADRKSISIACFYETLPLIGRVQIVEQPSATIPSYNNISIHADHRNVARFASVEEAGYKSIIGVLHHWAQQDMVRDFGADAEEFLRTLAFSEMGVRQVVIETAESGTCKWILEDPDYQAWASCRKLDKSHGLLWIKGKPGSGKSTLMKYIASKTPKPPGALRLVFFFNARGAEQERNCLGLFKSLLHQLVQESPHMRNRLLTHFRRKKHKVGTDPVTWSSAELRDMFFDTILFNSKTQVEIFVDALDECKEDEVRTIIGAFEKCAANYVDSGSQNLKICWSSRHYPHISIDRGFEIKVENMNFEDIKLWANRQLARSKHLISLSSVETEIVTKSNGVFLWSVLVVNKICKLMDKGLPLVKIQKVIHDLPSELGELYSQIFSTLDPDLAEDTANLIYMVLYATKPLDTDELRLGIEFMKKDYPTSLQAFVTLPEQVSYFRLFVTELSGGLLEVIDSGAATGNQPPEPEAALLDMLEDDGHFWKPGKATGKRKPVETRWIVQVIHESVRDFLLKDGMYHLPGHTTPLSFDVSTGHLRLYQVCKRILATDEMSCTLSQWRSEYLFASIPPLVELGARWRRTSIIKYALENIFFHLYSAGTVELLKHQTGPVWDSLPSELRDDIQRQSIIDAILRWECIRGADKFSRSADKSSRIADDLRRPSRHLQEIMELLHIGLEDFGTCAFDGHLCLMTLCRHSECSTSPALDAAISAVAHHGRNEDLAFLLSKLNTKTDVERMGTMPIQMAVKSRNEAAVTMLLDKGVLVNPPASGWATTPLATAIESGQSSIAFKLIQHGADVNCLSLFKVPLVEAARLGNLDIVQMLLDHGADVLAQDHNGNDALKVAVKAGHRLVAQLLNEAAVRRNIPGS